MRDVIEDVQRKWNCSERPTRETGTSMALGDAKASEEIWQDAGKIGKSVGLGYRPVPLVNTELFEDI